jgi:hypothetical protein
MDLKPGSRWKSDVCDTAVVVVRPPNGEATLGCGGHAMIPHESASSATHEIAADLAQGTSVGKRYSDAETGIELLCTKSGAGTVTVNGRPIGLKEAKKLPSSD